MQHRVCKLFVPKREHYAGIQRLASLIPAIAESGVHFKQSRAVSTHGLQDAPATAGTNVTPAMRQYYTVKRDPQYAGCIVLFQLGGFYEAFYEDAAVLSSVCGVAYTARGDTPMAGLPIDRIDTHMLKLLRKGHRIVLVDQADPVGGAALGSIGTAATRAAHAAAREAATGSRLIARMPSRVLTPGTSADILGASSASNHYIASVAFGMPSTHHPRGELTLPCALAWTDVSTGELYVRTCSARDLSAELNDINPAEIVLPSLYPELALPATAMVRRNAARSSGPRVPLPHINESMALELVTKLVKADQCKIVHEAQDQRRRVGVASRSVMDAAQHAKAHAVHTPTRLQLPGGDPEGSWMTFIPQTAFTAASFSLLSLFLEQHSQQRVGQADDEAASLQNSLCNVAGLEVSALSGLLRYLSWAYCGNLPWLSLPISMSTSPSTLPKDSMGSHAGKSRPSSATSMGQYGSNIEHTARAPLEPGEVDTPLSSASDLASEIEQVAVEMSTTAATQLLATHGRPFPSPLRMRMNESTQRALELVRPMHGRRRARGCLLELIDLCKTHMGSRLLDTRLVKPLAQLEPLLHRLDAVEALSGSRNIPAGQIRTVLRSGGMLGGMPDLERCVQRASMSSSRGTLSATASLAKDLATIRDGLVIAQRIGALLVDGDSLLWSDTSHSSRAHSLSLSTAVDTAKGKAIGAAAGALACMVHEVDEASSLSTVQALLLVSSSTEYDVVRRVSGHPRTSGASLKEPAWMKQAGGPLRDSLVLAQCAAVLTSACASTDAGPTAAELCAPAFQALHHAHRELQRALATPGVGSPLRTTNGGEQQSEDPPSLQSLSMAIRPGYSADLDSARARAANTGLLRRELERILRTVVGLPQESPVLKIKGGVASILGVGRVADGLYIEFDVKAKPNAELLDRCLAAQAASKAGQGQGHSETLMRALQGTAIEAGSPFSKLKPSDLYLQAAKSTQTLKRFRCDALTRLEVEVAEAGARAEALEARLVSSLAALVLQADEAVKAVCKALAVVDVSSSLAELADKHVLVRPVLTDNGRPIDVRGQEAFSPRALPSSHGPDRNSDVGTGELMLKNARHLIVEHALTVHGLREDELLLGLQEGAREEHEYDGTGEQAGLRMEAGDAAHEATHPRHAAFVSNDILLGAKFHHRGSHAVPTTMTKEWQPLWEGALEQQLAAELANSRCVLLLGPNMGGKSTYLRTAAQAVILAQIGSFVPATSAQLGLVDSIFCRVGASDDLAGHRSTFAVEMEEAAEILRSATSRSLVLVDELGRGTAALEGLALAEAILHQLAARGARTLFATHFRELTATALRSTAVRAMEMEWHPSLLPQADEVQVLGQQSGESAGEGLTIPPATAASEGDQVEPGILVTHRVKLHSVYSQMGSHSRTELMSVLGSGLSHGLAVAAHAGLPRAVLTRARGTLSALQNAKASETVVGVLLDSSEHKKPSQRASRPL